MVTTEGLELVVKREDIEGVAPRTGRPGECTCPIAAAFARVFGQTALVNYASQWRIDGTRELCAVAQVGRRLWRLPQIAVDFMRKWDQGIPCRPISFPLEEEVA